MANSHPPSDSSPRLHEYELYQKEAVAFWERALKDPLIGLGPTKSLSKPQVQRFNQWQRILDAAEMLNDADRKLLKHVNTVDQLGDFVGGGVWRVDYTREILSYEDFWSNSRFFNTKAGAKVFRDIFGRLQIPFGRGVIGYVLENLERFQATDEASFYVAHNSVGDLRGAVTIEDQFLGHINVLLVPIKGDGSQTTQLILSLFLPVPKVLTPDFCREFTRTMQWLGMQILTVWERKRYISLLKAIHPVDGLSDDPKTRLTSTLTNIAESLAGNRTTRSQNVALDQSRYLARHDASFPWVSLLNTAPIIRSTENGDNFDPFTTWITANSFIRPRVLKHMGRMLHLNWAVDKPEGRHFVEECQLGQFIPPSIRPTWCHEDSQASKVFVSDRKWDQTDKPEVFDIGLWCMNAAGERTGLIRVHVSQALHETAGGSLPNIRTYLTSLNENLEQLTTLGCWIDSVRKETIKGDPIAIKLERELEHLFWDSIFDDLGQRFQDGAPRINKREHQRNLLRTRFRETAAYEAVRTAFQNENASLRQVAFKLRAETADWLESVLSLPSLRSSVVGFSFWSMTPEVLLDAPGVDTVPPTPAAASRFRDLQRALSYLTISQWTRYGVDFGRWTTTWSVSDAQLQPKKYDKSQPADDIQQNARSFGPVTWHLFQMTTSESTTSELETLQITPQTHTDDLDGLPIRFTVSLSGKDGDWHEEQKWYLVRSWPRIRAYKVLGGSGVESFASNKGQRDRLRDHLSHIRAQRLVNDMPDFCHRYSEACIHGRCDQQQPFASPMDEQGQLTTTTTLPHHVRECIEKLARHETGGVKFVMGFPVQISRHVYSWLLLGTRWPVRGMENLIESAERLAVDTQLRHLAAEIELRVLEDAYADIHELREVEHKLLQPVERMLTNAEALVTYQTHNRLSEMPADLPGQLKSDSERVRVWALIYKDMHHSSQNNSLQFVLDGAFGFAKQRFEKSTHGQSVRLLEETFNEIVRAYPEIDAVLLSEANQQKCLMLSLLMGDALVNAARSALYGGTSARKMELDPKLLACWWTHLPEEHVLQIHIANRMGLMLDDNFVRWLQILNQSLDVARRRDVLANSGLGLRNIFAWSRRLRTPLWYRIDDRTSEMVCTLTIDLSHFLSRPNVPS